MKTKEPSFMEAMNREKYELYRLIKILKCEDKENLIEKALYYFKSQYYMRPFNYPGDGVLYDLFKRCIQMGLSMKESYDKTIKTIQRELILLDASFSVGNRYAENFIP